MDLPSLLTQTDRNRIDEYMRLSRAIDNYWTAEFIHGVMDLVSLFHSKLARKEHPKLPENSIVLSGEMAVRIQGFMGVITDMVAECLS